MSKLLYVTVFLSWISALFWISIVVTDVYVNNIRNRPLTINWDMCVIDAVNLAQEYACVGIVDVPKASQYIQAPYVVWVYPGNTTLTLSAMKPLGFLHGEPVMNPKKVPYTVTYPRKHPRLNMKASSPVNTSILCTVIALASTAAVFLTVRKNFLKSEDYVADIEQGTPFR